MINDSENVFNSNDTSGIAQCLDFFFYFFLFLFESAIIN